MSVQELLERARASGLTVFLKDDRVKVVAAQEPRDEARALIQELRERKEEILEALNQEDPIVSQDIMMEEFRRLQAGVIKTELKDFDYGWVRENQRDLYETIKAKEAEFEGTAGKPLSVLLGLIREWMELVREGYGLQVKPHQGGLNLEAKDKKDWRAPSAR